MKQENNTGLVEYGIEDETTDFRAHVCPVVKRVYVFETKSGVRAIRESGLKRAEVYSACAKCWGDKPDCLICGGKGKILTALGHPIPVSAIPGVSEVSLPPAWWEKAGIDESQSTSEKGDRAVKIVTGMIKTGRFPFMVSHEFITDRDIQISGTDIRVNLTLDVQVKCDFRGGDVALGGTGNLFIQTHESNPFGFN